MPVSKKQLRANRQNAQQSTGPKSVEGKEIASHNAVTYGLYSQDLIINSQNLKEDRQAFNYLLDSLLDSLQPTDAFQLYLVHKIADSLWRSRRAIRAETAEITCQLDNIEVDSSLRRQFLKIAHQIDGSEEKEVSPNEELRQLSIEIGRNSIPDQESSLNILRYEMRLDRQLTRAYKLLCQLQNRQNGNQTDTDGPTEIFVPVFKCPAAHGGECPQHPAVGAAPSQISPSPRPPLPTGEGPEEREDTGFHSPSHLVLTAEEGFNRPTVDIAPAQNHPSPGPPLPTGEGPEERDDIRFHSPSHLVLTAEEGFNRPSVDIAPAQNHPSPCSPLPTGEGPEERESSGFRQVLPAEGGCDLPGESPGPPTQKHSKLKSKPILAQPQGGHAGPTKNGEFREVNR